MLGLEPALIDDAGVESGYPSEETVVGSSEVENANPFARFRNEILSALTVTRLLLETIKALPCGNHASALSMMDRDSEAGINVQPACTKSRRESFMN